MTEDNYTANDIVKLEYPYSVWKRPSMYLGERGSQQTVGVREIIDNAVHESLRGYATKIKVTFGKDGSTTVQDDGRGLPTDVNKKTGVNGIVLTMATMHAGANFSSNVVAGKAGAGLNGVGGSTVTALANRTDVEVYKENKQYTLSFQDGFSGHFTGDGPGADFTAGDKIKIVADPRTVTEKRNFKKGTLIRFWFNPNRFPKDEKIDIDDLVDRLKYTAYIVPKLRIEITDENRTYEDGSYYNWTFYSEDGLPEMVEVMAPDAMLPNTDSKGNVFTEKGIYHLVTEGHYNEVTADEHGKIVDAKRTVTAEVSFRYGEGYDKTLVSFVNTIHTHLGGVHERAFEKALMKVFGGKISSTRGLLTAKDEPPIIDDLFEGMTVSLSVNVPEPQFVGQQKDKLSGPEVEKALFTAFTNVLSQFVEDAKLAKVVRPMLDKAVTASRNRQLAAEAKLAKRKSSQVASSALPAKLSDCDLTGTDESELIICEGDSAAGTIVRARDATYQAVIPVRGKPLNAYKASLKSIVMNKEVSDIAKAIGAGFGNDFDIEKARYGKIIFAADADPDGLQINNLLYTIFYRAFKSLLEAGRVYQAVPPLYEVKVGSGKTQEMLYASNETELSQIVKKLEKAKKTYKIDRNKGLGEMDPQPFYDTVLDPEKRTLKRITLDDVKTAELALELTMGDSSQDRKDFIGDNFQVAIDTGLVEGFENEI